MSIEALLRRMGEEVRRMREERERQIHRPIHPIFWPSQ
jgi:hypothetical protein